MTAGRKRGTGARITQRASCACAGRRCRKITGCEDKKALESAIKKKQKRLLNLFKGIEKTKQKLVLGLIERAAFMRVQLDELEDDLNTYGWTEWFSQGDQEPYKRKRPEAEVYNQTNGNYQKIIRQLTDLLPKSVEAPPDDGFDSFVTSRET